MTASLLAADQARRAQQKSNTSLLITGNDSRGTTKSPPPPASASKFTTLLDVLTKRLFGTYFSLRWRPFFCPFLSFLFAFVSFRLLVLFRSVSLFYYFILDVADEIPRPGIQLRSRKKLGEGYCKAHKETAISAE